MFGYIPKKNVKSKMRSFIESTLGRWWYWSKDM